jgi:hypothetical protein
MEYNEIRAIIQAEYNSKNCDTNYILFLVLQVLLIKHYKKEKGQHVLRQLYTIQKQKKIQLLMK